MLRSNDSFFPHGFESLSELGKNSAIVWSARDFRAVAGLAGLALISTPGGVNAVTVPCRRFDGGARHAAGR